MKKVRLTLKGLYGVTNLQYRCSTNIIVPSSEARRDSKSRVERISRVVDELGHINESCFFSDLIISAMQNRIQMYKYNGYHKTYIN